MNAPLATTIEEPSAMTTARKGVSQTEYRIVGTLQGVLDGCRNVFQTYPAGGYDTRINAMELGDEGYYVARMSRMNSCE